MELKEFFEICNQKGYSSKEIESFQKALNLCKEFLEDKKRLAGDSFLDHNIRVAATLIENKVSQDAVLVGLLKTILDHVSSQEIESIFGKEVTKILSHMDNFTEIKSKNKQLDAQAIRKILLTTVEDVRIIFVKLAIKLDNLRSLKYVTKKDQKRIAQEVLDIYAPLAYRLGLEKIKTQLEDEAFRFLKPKKYQEIQKFLQDSKQERDDLIKEFIATITKNSPVPITRIKGRSKNIYSIYKKITQRRVKLHDQFDFLGIRVVVSSVKDCYALLGMLHEKFEPIPGRLKDYIANPKPNGYQSLHTGVYVKPGKKCEIQIRTPEMDEFAEEGVAAHWQYKGMKSEQAFEKKMAWLRGVLDAQKDQKQFLEEVKIDLFGDKIYVYTPRGDVKELPKGASILDFAYTVHEQVGNKAIGGRVNGKFAPLRHQISHGDIVEILTNKNQRPRRNWIKFVTSSKAKQRIRKALKEFEDLPALHYRVFKPKVQEEQGVLVESEDFSQAQCSIAKCCHPIPGDEIVGIITKKRMISVHKQDCRFVVKEETRWVDVQWRNEFNQKIKFYIVAKERSGILADILNTIATAGFEVKEANAKLLGLDAECSFTVIPRDYDHLLEMIKRVNKVKGVKRIVFE